MREGIDVADVVGLDDHDPRWPFRLEAAIDLHDLAPRRQVRLALHEGAEDHAVALEERAGDRLDVARRRFRLEERPPARAFHHVAPLVLPGQQRPSGADPRPASEELDDLLGPALADFAPPNPLDDLA